MFVNQRGLYLTERLLAVGDCWDRISDCWEGRGNPDSVASFGPEGFPSWKTERIRRRPVLSPGRYTRILREEGGHEPSPLGSVCDQWVAGNRDVAVDRRGWYVVEPHTASNPEKNVEPWCSRWQTLPCADNSAASSFKISLTPVKTNACFRWLVSYCTPRQPH